MRLFEVEQDYVAFEQVLAEAHERVPMRTVAYCVMPNHWHFVLWPRENGHLSQFVHWLTTTHAKRWRGFRETQGHGHVYQWRFKSFPVQSDRYFYTVCRYVERNALRAGLVTRAEEWRWCSLYRRACGDPKARALLSEGPLPFPGGWVEEVNVPQTQAELDGVRACVLRGRPFGDEGWVRTMAERLGLLSTLRKRGRPRKH